VKKREGFEKEEGKTNLRGRESVKTDRQSGN